MLLPKSFRMRLVGFLAANRGRLKRGLPLFVGGEDCFCIRRTSAGGDFGALDRRAIVEAELALMMAPVRVAIGQSVAGALARQVVWLGLLGVASRSTLTYASRRLVVHGG